MQMKLRDCDELARERAVAALRVDQESVERERLNMKIERERFEEVIALRIFIIV